MRSLLIVWLVLAFAFVVPNRAGANPPEVVGRAAVLIDGETGQVLYEKNAHQRMYPASTTKTLTAIIALEKGKLTDMVVIPEEAAYAEGSSIGLKPGEKVSLEDLLYALMLNSGNDSAIAIADHIGGSVDGFVRMMNQKAAELGAVDSHFKNPNGLPDDDHYTTAYDLSLITRYAMQNDEFRRIVSTLTRDIRREDPEAQTFLLNHNKLLWRYEGATGVKTGYTVLANQCLASAAKRGDRELIAVVLGSEGENIWSDSTSLLDYGFGQFNRINFIDKGKYVDEVAARFGEEKVIVQAAGSFSYCFPAGRMPELHQEAVYKIPVIAPVEAGEKMGQMIYYAGGREIGRVDLIAQKPVKRKWYTYTALWVAGAALLLTVLLMYGGYQRRARRRRWAVYYHRKNRWDF
ncbi:MAG: D-alanyl-D-alanine carboxypeptidase [Firmicutes bacterium]|nr:D-alanyl-D-alanine carboxypeptidase [Bacillota bacterium]